MIFEAIALLSGIVEWSAKWKLKRRTISVLACFSGSIHSTPETFENIALCLWWPPVHTNQSQKWSVIKTLFNPGEFKLPAAFRLCVDRNWCRHYNVISLTGQCGQKIFDVSSEWNLCFQMRQRGVDGASLFDPWRKLKGTVLISLMV